MEQERTFRDPIEHIDIKAFDSTPIIDSMREMSFTARDTARAAEILNRMLEDKDCTIILCVAGSTSAGGCMHVYVDMVRHNMVDAIVATGATIVDMDFFEALGFRHYQRKPRVDDKSSESSISTGFMTPISMKSSSRSATTRSRRSPTAWRSGRTPPGSSSGRWAGTLMTNGKKKDSLVQAAYEREVPIFCPAFSDSSAGFRAGQAPGGEPGEPRVDRLGQGFPGVDGDQAPLARLGPVHDRRRRPEELRPGHGGLCRDPRTRGRCAQVCRADHRGRRPGRRLLQLDAEGGLLLGQGRYRLRADGLCRGDLGAAADRQLRLSQTPVGGRPHRRWSRIFEPVLAGEPK
jgi:hypothetical protein